MIVGCYTAHVYCENIQKQSCKGPHMSPGEFNGRNEREALAEATSNGWQIIGKKTAFCKYCKNPEKAISEKK